MTIKILKGLLLWVTAFITLFYISGVDSIVKYSSSLFIVLTLIIVFLLFLCYTTITEEELEELSGAKLLNKYIQKYLQK